MRSATIHGSGRPLHLVAVPQPGVLNAAYDLMRDRATLVITHRVVRMEDMDKIVV